MLQTIKTEWIRVLGVNIRYLEAGSGKPVVLLHGLGGWAGDWKGNIGPLARQYRVLAPDLVGHGLSDKLRDAPYDIPYFTQCLAELLDAWGLSEVALVGLSGGGPLAIEYGLAHPERLRRLVLVDSAGLGRDVAWHFRLAALPFAGPLVDLSSNFSASLPLMDAVAALVTKANIRFFGRMLAYDPAFVTEEWVEEKYQLFMMPGLKEAFIAIAKKGLSWRGQEVCLLDKLSSIPIPTLILWGRQDRIIPVSHAYAAHRAIAGSKLHIFDRCGHEPQREKAAEFNRVLADFLAS